MLFIGLLIGLIIYSLTTFPVAIATGWEGETWQLVCFVWGCVCGIGGMLCAIRT